MASHFAKHAREMMALAGRAVRRGRLDLDDLIDTYLALHPGSHPLVDDARRLDLAALVAAFAALPPSLLSAPRCVLVSRLDGFTHTPLAGPSLRAGLAPDGTLLAEAGLGHVSVLNIAAALCVLSIEQAKARRLLCGLPSEPEPGAMAIQLGVDEAALRAAIDLTQGALLDLLRGTGLPEVLVHAECDAAAVSERATRASQRVLAALAEMGLIERPIFVWIGSDVITDVLSPYARELRGALLTWAGQEPAALGEDVKTPPQPAGEDVIYALASDFTASDPALAAERAEADRTVGILRYSGEGLPFELLDLGRIEAGACDARLSDLGFSAPAPVLVRITVSLEDSEAVMLRTFLAALGARIIGAALVMEGVALSGRPGSIVLPRLLVEWSEGKMSLSNATPLVAGELVGYTDGQVAGGAVLSTPGASLLSPAHVAELVRAYGVAAVEVGGSGALEALVDARLSGTLTPDADVSWALVAAQSTSSGRPGVSAIGGYAAIALAVLHRFAGVRSAREDPAPVKRRASGRSFRIKA